MNKIIIGLVLSFFGLTGCSSTGQVTGQDNEEIVQVTGQVEQIELLYGEGIETVGIYQVGDHVSADTFFCNGLEIAEHLQSAYTTYGPKVYTQLALFYFSKKQCIIQEGFFISYISKEPSWTFYNKGEYYDFHVISTNDIKVDWAKKFITVVGVKLKSQGEVKPPETI